MKASVTVPKIVTVFERRALGLRIRCPGRKRRAETTAANGRDGWTAAMFHR
jgi:hypothetical protein